MYVIDIISMNFIQYSVISLILLVICELSWPIDLQLWYTIFFSILFTIVKISYVGF